MSEEINKAFVALAKATHGVKGSAILLNAGADLRDLADKYESENAKLREALKVVVAGYLAEPGSYFNWDEWYKKAKAALAGKGE